MVPLRSLDNKFSEKAGTRYIGLAPYETRRRKPKEVVTRLVVRKVSISYQQRIIVYDITRRQSNERKT
jgi:hypothetical protein